MLTHHVNPYEKPALKVDFFFIEGYPIEKQKVPIFVHTSMYDPNPNILSFLIVVVLFNQIPAVL